MRQIDLVKTIAGELGIDVAVVQAVVDKKHSLILRCLIEGEPVNTELGRYFPAVFLADETEVTYENGVGPMTYAANRNRDRVVPIFEWDTSTRQHVTDYAEVTDSVREQSATRTRNFIRSKAYKQLVFNKAKKGIRSNPRGV